MPAYSFDSRLRQQAIWATIGNNPNQYLFALSYGWYANGNLNTEKIGTGSSVPWNGLSWVTQTSTYDNLNRLSTFQDNGGGTTNQLNFNYDAFGNLGVTNSAGSFPINAGTPGPNTVYTAANQLPASTGAAYDSAGNETSIPGSCASANCVTYDAENRQVGFQTDTYSYDGDGQRVVSNTNSGTTVYVHDALGQLVAEYSTAVTTPVCTTCYLVADHLGSTRLVTDGSGTVKSLHDYMPFGQEITAGFAGRSSLFGATDNISMKFTGKERDTESGNDYFGARYYASTMGRFLSPDPAGVRAIKLVNPQTWNWYAYVQNNPLRYTDPTGMYTCKDDANKCATDRDKAFEASRQRDLQSKDKGVAAAAAAYGDPTKDNHVAVQYTDSEKGNTNISVSYNGKSASYGITVSIPGAATGTKLDALVGHEGVHVEQDQALGASFKSNGSFNKSLNLTSYDAENPAYHVETTIMQQSGQSWTLGQFTVNPSDTPSQIDSTINQFLADPANGYGVTPQNPGPPTLTMKKDKQ